MVVVPERAPVLVVLRLASHWSASFVCFFHLPAIEIAGKDTTFISVHQLFPGKSEIKVDGHCAWRFSAKAFLKTSGLYSRRAWRFSAKTLLKSPGHTSRRAWRFSAKTLHVLPPPPRTGTAASPHDPYDPSQAFLCLFSRTSVSSLIVSPMETGSSPRRNYQFPYGKLEGIPY